MANPYAAIDSVDAEPARLHIATCMGAGMSLRAVAAAAHLSATQVSAIKTGKARTCLPQTRDAILAVRPGVTRDASPDTREPFVPKIGTTRRIHALHALGWPHTEISARSGVHTATLSNQVGTWVTLSTHEAIERVFNELQGTPGPSERTRGWARRFGYLPPAAWDDIDHDLVPPVLDEVETTVIDEAAVHRVLGGDRDVELSAAEKREVVTILHRRGHTDTEVAEISGLNRPTAEKIRIRLGLPLNKAAIDWSEYGERRRDRTPA